MAYTTLGNQHKTSRTTLKIATTLTKLVILIILGIFALPLNYIHRKNPAYVWQLNAATRKPEVLRPLLHS